MFGSLRSSFRSAAIATAGLALAAATPATAAASAPSGPAFAAPGDVVSASRIWAPGFEYAKVWQLTYRSTSATGTSNTVTGTLVVPNGSTASTPIVGYAPGTHGLGDPCAPSRHLRAGDENEGLLMHQYARKGFAVVVTDYEGLGAPGPHTYSVGRSQGHAVLDAVRAAQRVTGSGLGNNAPVGVVGYSQGGQTAGWAAELAASYAPELNIKAFAAGAPPSDLRAVAEYNNGDAEAGFVFAAGVGLDAAYPELDLADDLNAAGTAAAADIADDCTADFEKYAGQSMDSYTTSPGLMNRPDWAARVAEQDLGKIKPKAPTLLYHSQGDEIIPIATSDSLRTAWCGRGGNVTYWRTNTGAHAFTAAVMSPQVTSWVADRLAGKPTSGNC
ncbi:alpha/beta fold hydrolase [Nocardioides speluncae]|uniref:alpha/beta fold hydrolase n=1 Tax=Nocardioides speluncae TaxID=2670337 RepID=UPI000D69AF6B|nr:alpha/beta fold hydrolase [Nocardioides speluncae]